MAYEILDHTADVGLKICSQTLHDIYIDAAKGFCEILFRGLVDPLEHTNISLQADTPEELFHDWLSEINYYYLVHEKLFSNFEIKHLNDKSLDIICYGEQFTENKHQRITEIKAVTYHQLYIKEDSGTWYAQVIFDV